MCAVRPDSSLTQSCCLLAISDRNFPSLATLSASIRVSFSKEWVEMIQGKKKTEGFFSHKEIERTLFTPMYLC